jgi:hypothetical protein
MHRFPAIFRTVVLTALFTAALLSPGRAQDDPAEALAMKKDVSRLRHELDSLKSMIRTHGNNIYYLNQSDSAGLWDNPFIEDQIEARLESANEEFIQRTQQWIIGAIVFGFLLALLMFTIRHKMLSRINLAEQQLLGLRNAYEEDLVKYGTLSLQQQEQKLQEFNKLVHADAEDGFAIEGYTDHSLPLRVADEIHRMRKRIQFMTEDAQTTKALSHSLKRLEDELNTGGYEVIDLVGKKYVDGLNVEARFVPAEDSSKEGEIITDVLRPQVNYMGVMIQQAKVEVSKTYS